MLRVSVVVGGLNRSTWRLQPWRYLWELANELAVRGHEVDVLSEEASSLSPRAAGLRCVDVASVRPAGLSRGPAEHLRGRRPDVVIWNVGATSALSLRPPRLPGCRNVAVFTSPLYRPSQLVHVRGLFLRAPIANAAHMIGSLLSPRMIASYLGSNFDRVIFPGRSVGDALVRAGLPSEVADVVPPGRDEDLYAAPSTRYEASEVVTFLYAGSPAPMRGVDLLVRAFAKVCATGSDVRLVILSRHERKELARLTNDLRGQVGRLGLDTRVDIVAGTLPRPAVIDWLARADAIVLPFRLVPSEAPLAVIEAAGAGKPLIASAYPAIADLAAPRSLLVPPGDVAALAHAMAHLAGDQVEREAMADAARRWYVSWPTWSDVGRLIETSILEGPGVQTGPTPAIDVASRASPSSNSTDGLRP